MKTKTLVIVFLVLLAIYLLAKLFSGNRESSFDPILINVDTARVTKLVLNPKATGGKEIRLELQDGIWYVANQDQRDPATAQTVKGILSQLNKIESKRIVAKSRDKWDTYEVNDSATQVRAFAGEEKVADFYLGGFKFDQARRTASSYMRKAGEDAVHLIEGFVSMQFNQGYDAFRNKQILQLDRQQVEKVTLDQQGQQTMAIQKVEGDWYFAGMELIDSAKAAQYISGLANVNGSEFANNFNESSTAEIIRLNVELATQATPLVVECYASGDSLKPFVFNGNQNPDAYFLSDSTALYYQLIGKFHDLVPTGDGL